MIPLHELLLQAARSAPQRPGVIFEDRVVTYGELEFRARRLASVLKARGVGRGDLVAFWAPNRPEFPEFLFATSLAGGIAVPLNHWWTGPEGARILEEYCPRVILAAPPQLELLAPERLRLQEVGVSSYIALGNQRAPGWESYDALVSGATPLQGPEEVALDDPALILFTSGSTGRSKGAVHTHRGLAHTATIMASELGLREGERTLHFLPLFSSCLEQLIPLTWARATHVILPKFDPGSVWESLERHEITHFDAVPTTLRWLLEVAPSALPGDLRLVSYASEPMPPSLIRAWVDRAPGVGFVQFYGMIEQLCLTVQKPWEQITRAGTVGRPMVGAQLRIVGEDGEDLPHGEAGEVLAATPTLMAGYWGDPEATARVVGDGWMHTGDLGRLDPDGYLVLESRLKQVIKSGGMTVVPREVEEALLRHPAVLEAAVVGLGDERWGEAVHAFVTLKPGRGATPAELRGFCRTVLAGYKCPKEVHVMRELPRTGIGKISRRRLVTDVVPVPRGRRWAMRQAGGES